MNTINKLSKLHIFTAAVLAANSIFGLILFLSIFNIIIKSNMILALLPLPLAVAGLISSIYLFSKHRWAIMAGIIYFAVQTIEFKTSSFTFSVAHGLKLNWSMVSPDNTQYITLNLSAIIMCIICSYLWVASSDGPEELKTENENAIKI